MEKLRNREKFVIFLFIGGLVFSGCSPVTPSVQPEETSPATPVSRSDTTAEISVVIDFGDQNIATYSADPQEAITALDALRQATDQANLELTVKDYDFGAFVESIGGYQSSGNKAWIYFINGASGTQAADQAELTPGDTVQWRYLEPN